MLAVLLHPDWVRETQVRGSETLSPISVASDFLCCCTYLTNSIFLKPLQLLLCIFCENLRTTVRVFGSCMSD